MNNTLHPELERRLWSLACRMTKLRVIMDRAPPLERVRAVGELTQLEARFSRLKARLSTLNARGAGWRQSLEAAYERQVDDLAANIQDYIIKLDSDRLLAAGALPSPRLT